MEGYHRDPRNSSFSCRPDPVTSTAVVVTVFSLLVVFTCIAAVWMRGSLPALLRALAKHRGPPELGKPLTLVYTDVEGSTELWEWNHQVQACSWHSPL